MMIKAQKIKLKWLVHAIIQKSKNNKLNKWQSNQLALEPEKK
ncbi:MAG: hypothetical protein RL708_2641 [Bacteroidota bacterium]|jgi:hypothetical protein